jgi:hypothetical protein
LEPEGKEEVKMGGLKQWYGPWRGAVRQPTRQAPRENTVLGKRKGIIKEKEEKKERNEGRLG